MSISDRLMLKAQAHPNVTLLDKVKRFAICLRSDAHRARERGETTLYCAREEIADSLEATIEQWENSDDEHG